MTAFIPKVGLNSMPLGFCGGHGEVEDTDEISDLLARAYLLLI